ncbi:3074_t:CDS:2, partial [Cetraspora pellucida]
MFLFQVFPFQLNILSQNIYESSTTHNKDAETIRNTHCNIPGRLANNDEQERNLETTPQDCTETFDQVRLHHKHTKEPISTYSFLRILGIQNKLKEYDHHFPKEKDKPVKTEVQTSFNDAQDSCQETGSRKVIAKQALESGRTEATHQCVGDESNPVCFYDVQRPNTEIGSDQNRQHNMCSISQPSGQSSITRNQHDSKINIGDVSQKEDQVEGSTCSRNPEYNDRLCISTSFQQERLDVEPQNIQQDSQFVGPIQGGLVYQQTQYSATNNSIQSSEGTSHDVPNNFPMDISELVLISNRYDNRSAMNLTNKEPSTSRANIRHNTSVENKLPNVRMAYLRKRLQKKGISQQAITLYAKALDPNSTSTVSSNIHTWTSWSTENARDPINCPINDILQFLTTKANEEKSYNTIAEYRSTISEIHEYINNRPIGQNRDIANLMLGIFRTNPPAEPENEIYDITPSLDYIVALDDNDHLQLISLAKKTAFLCALSSACHLSDLAHLDLTTIRFITNGIIIECINPKEANIIIGHEINKTDDVGLCPATALHYYLARMKELQHSEEQRTAIFLSHVGSHKLAAVDTITNWLKDIIRRLAPEGKAKDIRILSAMLAQNAGVDLNLILAL